MITLVPVYSNAWDSTTRAQMVLLLVLLCAHANNKYLVIFWDPCTTTKKSSIAIFSSVEEKSVHVVVVVVVAVVVVSQDRLQSLWSACVPSMMTIRCMRVAQLAPLRCGSDTHLYTGGLGLLGVVDAVIVSSKSLLKSHTARNDVPGGYIHRTLCPGIRPGRHTHASVHNGSLRCGSSNGDRR